MELVRSTSNAAIKRLRAVAQGKDRDLVLVEGARLVEEARRSGLALELVALREGGDPAPWLEAARTVVEVQADLFARLGSLRTTPDVIALAEPPREAAWAELATAPDALVVVACGVQDPGNLGALARTAEAAGARGLVVVDGGCRPTNPKALRGSMGSLFRLPWRVAADAADAARELEHLGVRCLRAATRGGARQADADWSGRVALWLSSEAGELPAPADRFAGVTIPLANGVESLNVTQAAAVLLFAAGRSEGGR